MNSPWGLVAHICKEFGFSYDYVLNSISWVNLQLMLSDAPKTVKQSDCEADYDNMPKATDEDLLNFLND